jgi:hypothetical protein
MKQENKDKIIAAQDLIDQANELVQSVIDSGDTYGVGFEIRLVKTKIDLVSSTGLKSLKNIITGLK